MLTAAHCLCNFDDGGLSKKIKLCLQNSESEEPPCKKSKTEHKSTCQSPINQNIKYDHSQGRYNQDDTNDNIASRFKAHDQVCYLHFNEIHVYAGSADLKNAESLNAVEKAFVMEVTLEPTARKPERTILGDGFDIGLVIMKDAFNSFGDISKSSNWRDLKPIRLPTTYINSFYNYSLSFIIFCSSFNKLVITCNYYLKMSTSPFPGTRLMDHLHRLQHLMQD